MKRVKDDLRQIMGIKEEPSFVRIFRHPEAIPQYTVGHGKRLAALEEMGQRHPGLILTGNSYRGIGLNDCVASANRAAMAAVTYLQSR
jgi:oxygen-dependent protoporphyrinogen oxidase